MKPLTEKQFWKSCLCGMSRPVELADEDLTKPFVYDREYGLFYVNPGHHQLAMATIYAWRNGFDSYLDMPEGRSRLNLSKGADSLMEKYQGVAMKSSVGTRVLAYLPSMLSETEKDHFGLIQYIG